MIKIFIFTVPESVQSQTVTPRKFDKSALEERDESMRAPEIVRQFLAETLGTFLLVLFGNGAIAQAVGRGDAEVTFVPIAFGYGFALMIGIMVRFFAFSKLFVKCILYKAITIRI